MRIRLYADYAPWPLWGPDGLLAEDALPLSAPLRQRIRAWLRAYDDATSPDAWSVPPESTDEEDAWVAEGAAIRQQLEMELGPEHEVVYET